MNTTTDHDHRSNTGFRDGIWHALGLAYPDLGEATHPAPPNTGLAGTFARATLCGRVAEVVRKLGLFDPRRHPDTTCQHCVWWEAIRTDMISATLARLGEPPSRGLAVALVEAILAAADTGGDGVDHPGTVELLAAVSAHAGESLIDAGCAEGCCDHPERSGCPITVVDCPACSVVTGGWAGEWEGRYLTEATVPVPCSRLRVMAGHYRIGAELLERAQLPDSLTMPAVAGGGS